MVAPFVALGDVGVDESVGTRAAPKGIGARATDDDIVTTVAYDPLLSEVLADVTFESELKAIPASSYASDLR